MSGFVTFVLAHYVEIMVAIVALIAAFIILLKAFIVICLMIPGEQPEATLQKIVDKLQSGVDFLEKFSKKPQIK